MSYLDEGSHRYYEISIKKWIKNPQQDQTITMKSIAPKVFNPHFPYAIFAKKDLGLFYLKSVDGEWHSTNYSKQIWASELSQTIYDMKKLVGNNNPDSSISIERVCKEGYVNAVKNRTGEIACVKLYTADILIKRGWAKIHSGVNSLFADPGTKSLTAFCSPDETLYTWGYYVQKDSTLKITKKETISNEYGQQGYLVEFFTPDEFSQYAYVWVDCNKT